MEIMRLDPQCAACLKDKYLNKVPQTATAEERLAYQDEVLRLIAEAPPAVSAPELIADITALQRAMFGWSEDFTTIKRHFNAKMSSLAGEIRDAITAATDPLYLAISYAMLGNYIDFGAMDSVSEEKLQSLLAQAESLRLNATEYNQLKAELGSAKRLVYLTDNCGEIVMDRLLVEQLLRQFPGLSVTVIVRGKPVLNDATMEDASQIGLDQMVPVIGNGTGVAGTSLRLISKPARQAIDAADVVIAKGLGNFETLRHCGKNIYYLFLCKCQMFADRFSVPRYTGILCNDHRCV